MAKKPAPKSKPTKDPRPTRTSNENAPMCKVCKHRHWAREPHVFG